MRIQFVIYFILLFANYKCIGQVDTINKKSQVINCYVGFGGGSFISKSSLLEGWRLSLNANLNSKYTLEGLHQESDFLPDLKGSPESKANEMLSVKTWMILLGINKQYNKIVSLNVASGVSFGSYRYLGNYLYSTEHGSGFFGWEENIYEHENKTYIGLPINLELKFTTKKIGGGVNLFANFHKHPEVGLLLNLLIGKIR